MVFKIFSGEDPPDGLIQTFLSLIPHQQTLNPEQADYIIFPDNIRSEIPQSIIDKLAKFKFISEDCGKKILIFMVIDFTDPLAGFENAIVYRTSLLKSRQLPYERILPYLWGVYLPQAFEPVRNQKPKVGFCGAITHPERIVQLSCLLSECGQLLESNFIGREKTWGQDVTHSRDHFWINMRDCEFMACPRGCGNFSIRLYETLSAGRIPILVKTDMLLPFEDSIAWNEVAVIADSVNELPARIEQFLLKNNLEEAQRTCRKVFDEFFTIRTYAAYLQQCMESRQF